MSVCTFHPDRTAIGICVRCRTRICAACCTRMDGINHCHVCLQALSQRLTVLPAGRGLVLFGALCMLATSWLCFFGTLWLVQGRLAP